MSTAIALNVLVMPKRKAPPRRLRSDRTFLTKDELIGALTAARAHSARSWAMILVAYKHGLRVSELCRLRLVDDPAEKDSFLDIESNTLLIRRLKGSARTIQTLMPSTNPLFDEPSVIQAYLRVRKVNGGDFAFASREGGALDPSQFFRIFQDVCAEAGIGPEKRFPHILKHTRASLLVKSGGEIAHVKQFLGHRAISSTQIYCQLNDSEAVEAAMAIDRGMFECI